MESRPPFITMVRNGPTKASRFSYGSYHRPRLNYLGRRRPSHKTKTTHSSPPIHRRFLPEIVRQQLASGYQTAPIIEVSPSRSYRTGSHTVLPNIGQPDIPAKRVRKSRSRSRTSPREPVANDDEELRVTWQDHGKTLGTALWLHRFVYNTRKRLQESRRRSLGDEIEESPTGNLEAEVADQQRSFVIDRRGSWSTLRTKLIRAKVTDALVNPKFEVNGVMYTSLRVIGQGGYSVVHEVFEEDKTLMALKVVNLSGLDPALKTDLLMEIGYLNKLKGFDHVIQLLDFEHHKSDNGQETLYILMERGECDLSSILNQLHTKERLTPSKLRYFWEQMLEAVQVIHNQRIVHADVKPSNFLLVRGQLKLIDFGFAGELEPGEEFLNRDCVVGTRDYISPESFAYFVIEDGAVDWMAMKERQYQIKVGFKSDIWALGVILHQLVYRGAAPFSSLPGGKLGKFKALIDPDFPVEFEPVEDLDLMDTMKLCLVKDPNQRGDLASLLNHPFLR